MFSLLVVGLAVGVGAYSGLSGQSEDGRDSQLAVNGMLTAGGDSLFRSGYDLSSHQTLSRVILLIRENYVDPERVEPRIAGVRVDSDFAERETRRYLL